MSKIDEPNIRRFVHTVSNETVRDWNKQTDRGDGNPDEKRRMHCVAFQGTGKSDKKYVASSGGVGPVPLPDWRSNTETVDQYVAHIIFNNHQGKLPWSRCAPTAGRPFEVCAEAHIWAKLINEGKNPKKWNVVAFNDAGQIVTPCENCKQWVGDTFQNAERNTPAFEGRVKQRKDYRG